MKYRDSLNIFRPMSPGTKMLGGIGGGGGIDWTTYWTTREPSDVSAEITSDTTATITWIDSVVPGADGYKIYAGATLKVTVAVGVQTASITGLTANTSYVFKVVAHKGTNESTGDTDTKTTSGVIGAILDDQFTSISANWITTSIGGGGSFTSDGANAIYVRTGSGDFASKVFFIGLGLTMLDEWEIEIIEFGTINATSIGLFIGVCSLPGRASGEHNVCGGVNMATLGHGRRSIWDHTTNNYASDSLFTAPSTNDRMLIRFTKLKNVYILYAKNLNTNEEGSVSHTWTFNDATEIMTTPAYPYIQNLGGTWNIEYFKFSSTAWKRPNMLFIGDSITQGYEVSDIANRFTSLIDAATTKTITRLASVGAVINEVSAMMTEIAMIAPTKAIIMIGTNNVLNGDALATMQGYYTTMINSIVALGITPVICTICPNNTVDVRPLNSWLIATYGGTYTVIDIYTALVGVAPNWNATYAATGNVHPNDAGHQKIYETIISRIPILI